MYHRAILYWWRSTMRLCVLLQTCAKEAVWEDGE